MGNTITKLMNFRNTTLALTLAATTGAIKITSNDVLDDIGDAFGDAYDWTEGAADDIANFAKENQDVLIGTGSAIATGGGLYLLGAPVAEGEQVLYDVEE